MSKQNRTDAMFAGANRTDETSEDIFAGKSISKIMTSSGAVVKLKTPVMIDVKILTENPANKFEPLADDELRELSENIKQYGVLQPLIAHRGMNGLHVLICGHNRLRAARLAGLDTVPVQIVSEPEIIDRDLELELMRSENTLRRGGRIDKKWKVDFIKKHFKKELEGGKSSVNFSEKVFQESGGKITEGTAKRLIAEIKKDLKIRDKPDNSETARAKRELDRLSAKLEKIRAKLAQIRTLEVHLKAEEKEILKKIDGHGKAGQSTKRPGKK